MDVTEADAVDPLELIEAGLRLTRLAVLTASDVHVPPHPNTNATYRRLSGDEEHRQLQGRMGRQAGHPRTRLSAISRHRLT